jgi:ubiquinone/menaquinone biosynthesis C-methylase UbiE
MTISQTTSPASEPAWVCPCCLGVLVAQEDGAWACSSCPARYPVVDDIPILEPDAQEHLAEMDRMVADNAAWYESDQLTWYDSGPCRHHLARRRSAIEKVLRDFVGGDGKAQRLLDLGCGDGANSRWLQSFAKRFDACDYNLLRLRRCRRLLGDRGSLCLADILRLPYPAEAFDAIFMNHVLEHIPDDERALQSVWRVLRPGGLLILGVPNEGASWWQLAYRLSPETRRTTDHVHFYTAKEVEEKASEVGYIIERTIHTGWGPPHWKLDEWIRSHRWVDDTFEAVGSRLIPGQCTSLYFVLRKPCEMPESSRKLANVEVVLYDPEWREQWDALVARAPEAWAFHSRAFLDMVGPAKKLKECSLVAIKDGRVVGILPLNYWTPGRPRVMGSMAFGSGGMAFDPDLGTHEREEIEDLLLARATRLSLQEGCVALEIALSPLAEARLSDTHGVSPLDRYGFAATSTSSYIVRLDREEEDILSAMSAIARRKMRRAEKSGVAVRMADRPSDLDAYYRTHCETYRRTGVEPHPRAYFEGIFTTMVEAGVSRIFVAEREGEPLGFLNVAHFKETAYFWTGCSTDEGLECGANYLLQWHAMRDARSRGVRFYEVGEAFPGHRDDKLAGLDRFKSAFGGERRPFHKGRLAIGAERHPSRLRLALYYMKRAVQCLIRK